MRGIKFLNFTKKKSEYLMEIVSSVHGFGLKMKEVFKIAWW